MPQGYLPGLGASQYASAPSPMGACRGAESAYAGLDPPRPRLPGRSFEGTAKPCPYGNAGPGLRGALSARTTGSGFELGNRASRRACRETKQHAHPSQCALAVAHRGGRGAQPLCVLFRPPRLGARGLNMVAKDWMP